MANVLIVHAHPEPRSFSSALARTAADALRENGHTVTVSDLYSMQFNPVSSRSNFTTVADPTYLKLQVEETHATAHNGFSPEIDAEIQKLEAADLLIFSFPMWWFGMPAILKGWIDRVFAYSRIYGEGHWYEKGRGIGKRAFALITTGSPESAFGNAGLHASLDDILAPLHHGVYWFNGYTPLAPFLTWSAAHISADARAQELVRLRTRLKSIMAEAGERYAPSSEHVTGLWRDTFSRFAVTAKARISTEKSEDVFTTADENLLLDLRRSGVLQSVLLAPRTARPWQGIFELRAANADDALRLVQQLPLSEHCVLEVSPVDPTLDDATSPVFRRSSTTNP